MVLALVKAERLVIKIFYDDFHYRLKADRGQALIEMIFALAMIGLIVVGLTRASSAALKNAQFARNHAKATELAQRATEQARQLRDQDPTTFWGLSGPVLTPDVAPGFDQTITYTQSDGGNKMTVEVAIVWEDAKGTHSTETVTYLTRWSSVTPGP